MNVAIQQRSSIVDSAAGKTILLLTVILFVISVVFIALYAVEKAKDSASNTNDEAPSKTSKCY